MTCVYIWERIHRYGECPLVVGGDGIKVDDLLERYIYELSTSRIELQSPTQLYKAIAFL